ncbi:MAG: hypothetical protein AB7T22_02030 [Calditrichaceae bacterium]
MKTHTLTNQIEAFIADGIAFKYDTQITDVLFLLDKGPLKESSYSVKNNNITLSGIYPGMSRERFRLPQTKIYYTLIQNEKLKIQIIEFQNDSIFIISAFSEKARIQLKVKQNNNCQVFCSLNPEIPSPALLDLAIEETEIIWVTDNDNILSMNELTRCLKKHYQDEIAGHPVHYISSLNKNLLMNMDRCWVNLDCINMGREIDSKISAQKFIWLQEVYLYFGWYDELLTFYKSEQKLAAGLDDSAVSLREMARNRFILSHQGQKNAQNDKEKSFLNSYLNGELIDDAELNAELHLFWERINKPAMKSYFKRSFMINPHEIIAFAMLAADRNFWWTDTIRKKILHLITESAINSITPIIELLFYLKSDHLNIAINANGRHFTGTAQNFGKSEVKMVDPAICFKNQLENSLIHTSAKLRDVFLFRMDKNVRIHYQAEKKLLKIYPVVFHHPVSENSLNYIQIESSNIRFDIPLIWRNFTADLNGNRFKFLLKKDRYQVSIKRKPSESLLSLNSEKILFEDSLYTKIYLNIKKQSSHSYFSIYDQTGTKIVGFGPHIKQIIPRGHGYNAMGTLIEEFQISCGRSAKGSKIITNSINPLAIDILSLELQLIFRAKKFLPFSMSFSEMDGTFWRLLQTESDLLNIRLIFYLEDYTNKKRQYLRELCTQYLGFYPSIKQINELSFLKDQFAVIVGSSLIYENEIKYNGFTSIKSKDSGNRRVIYVDEKRLKYFFENFPVLGPEQIK